MATAELAVAMPAVLLVLALALSACGAAVDQIRCVDAARVTVRLLARGESRDSAVLAGRAAAPEGSDIAVGHSVGEVTVTVTVTAPAPWALRWLGVHASPSAEATGAIESALPGGHPWPAGSP